MRTTFAAIAVAALAGAVHAQALMVVESSNDRVMLFDPFDGSLISDNFIDLASQGASTPINAVNVGSEIWVSDQLADSVFRYSLTGAHLGTISGGLDNIRGFEVVGNTVYMTNSGSNNGAPGDGIITIDVPTATITGFFTAGSDGAGDPFDALSYGGGLLINDIAGEDIDQFDLSGNFLSTFVDSDGVNGIDFPEQMNLNAAGNVLVAGFSSPAGIYEYDSEGALVNFYNVGTGVRGVWELGNGNIMFTDGSGVHILVPGTGEVTTALDGVSGRFIEFLVPAPGSTALLGLAGLFAARRRR